MFSNVESASWLPLWGAAVATAILLATRLYKPLTDFLILTKIPHPKDNFILGNISMQRPDQHRLMLKYARELGGVYGLRLLWQQVCLNFLPSYASSSQLLTPPSSWVCT